MRKPVKYILLSIAGALGVVVIGALIFVLTFDANDYRGRLAEFVKNRTGRDLSVENIEVSLYPLFAVSVDNATLGNSAAYPDVPFLTVKHASIGIRPIQAFFYDHIATGPIKLYGVNMHVARDKQGRLSWEDLVGEQAAERIEQSSETNATPGEDGAEGGGLRYALSAEKIDVRDLNILYEDAEEGRTLTLRDLSLETGRIDPAEPFDFTLTFGTLSSDPRVTASAELTGSATVDQIARIYDLRSVSAKLESTGRDVSVKRADATASARDVHLDMNVREITAVGVKAQAEADVSGDFAGTISAALTAADGGYQFETSLAKATEVSVEAVANGDLLTAEEVSSDGNTSNGQKTSIAGAVVSLTATTPSIQYEGDRLTVPSLHVQTEGSADSVTDLLGGTTFSAALQTAAAELGLDVLRASVQSLDVNATGQSRIESEDSEATNVSFTAALTTPDATYGGKQTGGTGGTSDVGAVSLSGLTLKLDGKLSGGLEAQGHAEARTADADFNPGTGRLTVVGPGLNVDAFGRDVPGERTQARLAAKNVSAEFGEGAYHVAGLDADALGASLTGDLDLTGAAEEEGPQLAGNVKIPPFNLRKTLSDLDLLKFRTTDPEALTSVGLDTSLKVSSKLVELSGLTLTADGSTVTGDVTLNDIEKGIGSFDLHADRIDVDRYLPPKNDLEDVKQPAPAGKASGKDDDVEIVPVDRIRAMNLHGRLAVSDLTAAGIQAHQVKVGVDADKGQLTVYPASANLYDGSFLSALHVDARKSMPQTSVAVRVSGLQLGRLVHDLNGKDSPAGLINLSSNLVTRGRTQADMRQRLEGDYSVAMLDGVFPGVDLARISQEAKKGAEEIVQRETSETNATAPDSDETGQSTVPSANLNALPSTSQGADAQPRYSSNASSRTSFGQVTASGIIDNGILRNEDLEVKAPSIRVVGDGRVNLVTERVHYSLHVKLAATGTGQGGRSYGDVPGIPIPIYVTGALSDPSFIVNIPEYVRMIGAGALGTVGGVLQGVGNILTGGILNRELEKSRERRAEAARREALENRPENPARDILEGRR